MFNRFSSFFIAFSLLVSANASATLIYENATLEGDANGHGNTVSSFVGSDSFTLDESALINRIEFDLSVSSGNIDDLRFDLSVGTEAYGDSLYSQSFSLGPISRLIQSAILDIYTVTIADLSFEFEAGEEYWLTYRSEDLSPGFGVAVTPSQVLTVDGDGTRLECNNCSTPRVLGYDTVFRLYEASSSTPVSEPSAILLVFAGLFGAGFARRRRQ